MRVVSLFSGAGGLDLGFILAGHKIVWANDNFPDAVETYRINIGEHIILGEIEKIDASSIPDCDIVIGGFPCQGFSVANVNRHIKDSRNQLYLQLLRVIKNKKPKFFLAENVKGLLSLDKGKVMQLILSDFTFAGYDVTYKCLNAANFGVPQTRERVIIIGKRNNVKGKIAFPEPTHSEKGGDLFSNFMPWVSVGEALSVIPPPDEKHTLKNHTYSKYKLRFNGYLGHRKINPNRPSPTVTGRGDERGGVVVLHHPNNTRRMSARELATVQSFPLDYEFHGCQSSVYRQISNAVPPLLAKAVAETFTIKCLK